MIMRKIYLLFIPFLLSVSLFAQSKVEIPLKNQEWSNFYEDNNVILSSITRLCSDQAGGPSANYVFISFENKTEQNVSVQWHYDIFSSVECHSCDDPDNEYKFWYNLEPGQTIIPDCDSKSAKTEDDTKVVSFAIFLSMAEASEEMDVVKVELSDLISNTIQ